MTEERLTELISEASELSPSSDLRNRIADFQPRPRRTAWFALSGVAAACAAVALLAVPRTVAAAPSAMELFRRSGEAFKSNRTYESRTERLIDGKWVPILQSANAPGWRLQKFTDGTFNLQTPDAFYRRFQPDGPVVVTHAVKPVPGTKDLLNDPAPEAYARYLPLIASNGKSKYSLPLTAGNVYEEGARKLRDVLIPLGRESRMRFVVDAKTDLPVQTASESLIDGAWKPRQRVTYAFPGPAAGSNAFTHVFQSERIEDSDALGKAWEKRLSKVQNFLQAKGGISLELRDLRALPNGDVLILYTGPGSVSVNLTGPHGEPYTTCYFAPNQGFLRPRSAAVLQASGKLVNGMWFVPLHRDQAISGQFRLRIYGDDLKMAGDYPLTIAAQKEEAPPYRDAIDAKPFGTSNDFRRTSARINALANQWLDGKGYGFSTTNPDLYPSLLGIGEDGPFQQTKGWRHDPKAAAEAARLMRQLVTRPRDMWLYLDESRAAPLLAKLDRWSSQKP